MPLLSVTATVKVNVPAVVGVPEMTPAATNAASCALAIGVAVFGEKQTVRDIAPGAVVMLMGVALLSLSG